MAEPRVSGYTPWTAEQHAADRARRRALVPLLDRPCKLNARGAEKLPGGYLGRAGKIVGRSKDGKRMWVLFDDLRWKQAIDKTLLDIEGA